MLYFVARPCSRAQHNTWYNEASNVCLCHLDTKIFGFPGRGQEIQGDAPEGSQSSSSGKGGAGRRLQSQGLVGAQPDSNPSSVTCQMRDLEQVWWRPW